MYNANSIIKYYLAGPVFSLVSFVPALHDPALSSVENPILRNIVFASLSNRECLVR